MKQPDFTPGPWFLSQESNVSIDIRSSRNREDLKHNHIVSCCIESTQDLANARLIAAAPDLLAAIEYYRSTGSDKLFKGACEAAGV